MPPKTRTTKKMLLDCAIEMVRRDGFDAVNARALAHALGCSTQPIFSCYKSMDELKIEILSEAAKLYASRIREEIQSEKYPAYKASGMAYIKFACSKKQLFKLLFMNGRSGENKIVDDNYTDIIKIICSSTGLDEHTAQKLHLLMWSFVHGIATMLCTDYLDWTEEQISWALTCEYEGLMHAFGIKERQ